MSALQFIYVFLGGGIGASARWLLSLLANRFVGSFSLGVVLANLAGCFLAGCLFGAVKSRFAIHPDFHLFLLTGFLGGFTTFSAFAVDHLNLLEERPLHAFLYVVVNVVLCLLSAYAGSRIFARQ